MSRVIIRAREIATQAHEGQLRKFTGEPYITHPEAVAVFVEDYLEWWATGRDKFPWADEIIAAALLHDSVEDSTDGPEAMMALIKSDVSFRVMKIVESLSRVGRKKEMEYQKYILLQAKQPWWVALIKFMDVRHNLSSLPETEKSLLKRYTKAKDTLQLVHPDFSTWESQYR